MHQALQLSSSDAVGVLLLQVCGPAHIPWQDARWQELLHAYGLWAHVEPHQPLMALATSQLVHNAPLSSNVAALTRHVIRLLCDLLPRNTTAEVAAAASSSSSSAVDDFSSRIAIVAKARATAGALRLLQLLIHPTLVHAAHLPDTDDAYLQQVFTYTSRDVGTQPDDSVASDFVQTLVTFVLQVHAYSVVVVPELYDVVMNVMQLVLVLSGSQLYTPMLSTSTTTTSSSTTTTDHYGFFWELLLEQSQATTADLAEEEENDNTTGGCWSPRDLLYVLLDWIVTRPEAPERSIQYYYGQLSQSIVQAATSHDNQSYTLGRDGMYESHLVVMAEAPAQLPVNSIVAHASSQHNNHQQRQLVQQQQQQQHSYLLDATKGVLTLSSTIILLPFRLLSLALHLLQHHQLQSKRGNNNNHQYEAHYRQARQHQQQSLWSKPDVLWLSKSPLADLAASWVLLLLNNQRAPQEENDIDETISVAVNPFRDVFANLTDNRWDYTTTGATSASSPMNDRNSMSMGLPDLPMIFSEQRNNNNNNNEIEPLLAEDSSPFAAVSSSPNALPVNFEALFKMFGRTVHNELGALLLYTMMQASTLLADSIAVRSDLDTLVLPLLRTLYFSSSSVKHYDSLSHGGNISQTNLSLRTCPFRSLSQLYVIIILLLLFSQDSSFGSDAFRRVMVPNVLWYKERNLKDISLGSILLLCLLRALTFNLNRLQDPFLLSNCCAICMNLSTSISDLHEYAAMRLASVAISSMKKYATLRKENPSWVENNDDDDNADDLLSTRLSMHEEVCQTLLRVIKQCFSTKSIDKNLHLIYAMVYHQTDFKKIVQAQGTYHNMMDRLNNDCHQQELFSHTKHPLVLLL